MMGGDGLGYFGTHVQNKQNVPEASGNSRCSKTLSEQQRQPSSTYHVNFAALKHNMAASTSQEGPPARDP
jgi:hypothetical protein